MTDPLKAATQWYLRINAENASDEDQLAFQHWKEASVENNQAWQRIQLVNESFDGLAPNITRATLLQRELISVSRRDALKKMGILFFVGSGGLIAYRQQPWQSVFADYATDKGVSRSLQLSDQTKLVLNTQTAIDVEYQLTSRRIKLIKGEILVETGHGEGSEVPFKVQTKYGIVTALGTRFSVRLHADSISVNVYQDSVQITTSDNSRQKILTVNQTASFTEDHISEVNPLPLGSDLWVKGVLVVNNMPLKVFLAEINRYHAGVFRCDPIIASLSISGSFPLNDIQAILSNLQKTYPIHVESITQYWISLKPV